MGPSMGYDDDGMSGDEFGDMDYGMDDDYESEYDQESGSLDDAAYHQLAMQERA